MRRMRKTQTGLVIGLTMLQLVASWALWSGCLFLWDVGPTVHRGLELIFSDPIFFRDGEPVGYHFFVLRQLLIALSIAFVGIATRSAVRAVRSSSRRALLGSALAILLGSQFMGFTLLAFFPEYHLANLVIYHAFPANEHFADGFSTRKFFRVTPGMERREVERILGRGRRATTIPGYEDACWMYSGNWSETAWRFWIDFDKEGKVEKRDAYFWFD